MSEVSEHSVTPPKIAEAVRVEDPAATAVPVVIYGAEASLAGLTVTALGLLETKETLVGLIFVTVAVNGQVSPVLKVFGLGVRVTVQAATEISDVSKQVPPRLIVAVAVTVEDPLETPVTVVS
jgi:hypothetical protein